MIFYEQKEEFKINNKAPIAPSIDEFFRVQRESDKFAEDKKSIADKEAYSNLSFQEKVGKGAWEGVKKIGGGLLNLFNATKYKGAREYDEKAEANLAPNETMNRVGQYDRDMNKNVSQYTKIEDFYNKNLEDYNRLQAGIAEMPINSQEYYNNKKELEKKGKYIEEISTQLNQLGSGIGKIQKEKEEYEKTRGPEMMYFNNENAGKAFVTEALPQPEITESGDIDADNAKRDDIAKTQKKMFASMMQTDYEVYGETWKKAGNSFDGSLLEDKELYRDYISAAGKAMDKHYDEIFVNGKLDPEKFEQVMLNDKDFYEAYKAKELSNIKKRKIANEEFYQGREDAIVDAKGFNPIGKALSTAYNFFMQGESNLSGRGKEFGAKRKLGLIGDALESDTDYKVNNRVGRLPNFTYNVVKDTDDNWTTSAKFHDLITRDPYATLMLPIDAYIAVAGGGATLPKYLKYAKNLDSLEALSLFRRGKIVNLAKNIGRENMAGLALDAHIDSISKEGSVGMNIMFNSLGGILNKGKALGTTDSIMKEVLENVGDTKKQLEILGTLGKGFTEETLKDTEKLWTKIDEARKFLNVDENGLKKVWLAEASVALDNVDDVEFVNSIGDTIKKIAVGDATAGEVFSEKFTKIEEAINNYNSATTAEAKASIVDTMKQDLKDVMGSLSNEAVNDMYNMKIKSNLKNGVVESTFNKGMELYGDKNLATFVAIESTLGDSKSVNELLKKIGKENPAGVMKLDTSAGVSFMEEALAKGRELKKLEDIDIVKYAKEVQKRADDIAASASKLNATAKSSFDVANDLNSNPVLVRKGMDSIGSQMQSGMSASNVVKTQSNIGAMYSKMITGDSSFVKNIDNIAGAVYDSLPKKIKDNMVRYYGKDAKKIFMKKSMDYISGGVSAKADILEEFTAKGIIGIDDHMIDVADSVSDTVRAAKELNPKLDIEDILSKAKIANIIEDIGSKADITKLNKIKKITKQQETLIKGVGAVGGQNRIPSLTETAVEVSRAISNGVTPSINAAYFSHGGIKLLNTVFEGVEGYTPELVNRMFRKSQSIMSAYMQKLGDFVAPDGTLLLKGQINGVEVSLTDILKGIDLRLTDEGLTQGAVQGGIIYSHGQVLSKYMVLTDADAFLDDFAEIVNIHFTNNKRNIEEIGSALEDYVGKQKTVGESLVATYRKLDATLAEKGMNVADRADILHPLLFNPDEYLLGIRNSISVEDTLLYTLSQRNMKNFLGSDAESILKNIIRETPDNAKTFEKFLTDSPEATALRNKNANDIEKVMRDYADTKKGLKWNVEPKLFDQYRNTIAGYFTAADKVGYSYSFSKGVQRGVNDLVIEATKGMPTQGPIVGAVNKMLDDLLQYNSNTGKLDDLIGKTDELKSYLKKEGIDSDDINGLLDDFINNTERREKASASLVNSFRITDEIAPVAPNFPTVPETVEDIISNIEKRNFVYKKMENIDRVAQEQMITRALFDPSNLKNNLKDVYSISKSLGLSDGVLSEILRKYGLNEKTIKGMVKEGKKLTPEQMNDVISTALAKGDLSMSEAFENRNFRDSLKNMLDDVDVTDKGQYYTLDRSGNTVLKDDTEFGGLFKAITSLNTMSKTDKGLEGLLKRWTEAAKGSVIEPAFKHGNFKPKMGKRAYFKNVRNTLAEKMRKAGLKEADLKAMVDDVFADNFFSTKNKKFTELSTEAEKASGIVSPKQELYNMLIDYKNDLSRMRGSKAQDMRDVMKGEVDGAKFGASSPKYYSQNLANRLTGEWVFLANDDIKYIKNKMEMKRAGEGASSLKRGAERLRDVSFGNFSRDILYGGLFDKSIYSKGSNILTKASLLLMFGPTNILKAPQQMINNILDARSRYRNMSFDGKAFEDLQKYLAGKVDINLFQAGARDIAKGSSTPIGNMFDNLLQKFSVLNRGDQATKSFAIKGSMADAMYPIMEAGGIEGVEKFVKSYDDMTVFMEKYGLGAGDFYRKDHVVKQIEDIASSNAEDATKALEEFDSYAIFYKNDIKKLESRMRASYASFYATDVIPELSSSRIVDNQKSFFALKKRAISRFGEYAFEITSDVKKYGWTEFVKKVGKGEIKSMNKIATQIVDGLRVGYFMDRATDGEISTMTAMEYLAVPMVVLNMTIGDGLRQARGNASGYLENTKGKDVSGSRGANAAAILLTDTISSLGSTAWMYQKYVIEKLAKAWETGNEAEEKKGKVMVETLVKNLVLRPFTKYFTSNYGGYEMDTDMDGSFVTDLFKAGLNMQSTSEKEQQKAISELYLSDIAARGGMGRYIGNSLYGLLPIGDKYTGLASADVGVLNGLTRDRKNQNNVGLFYDKYAATRDPENFDSLLGNYDRIALEARFAGDDNQAQLEKLGVSFDDIKDMTTEELIGAALKAGVIPSTAYSDVYSDTIKVLEGKIGISEGLKSAYRELIPEEDQLAMVNLAETMWNQYAKEGKQKTESFTVDFLDAVSELGTNYTMAGYLTAARLGAKKSIQAEVGIKDNEFKFGAGDIEVGDTVISSVNEKDIEFYKKFVGAQHEILKGVWEQVGSQGIVGIDLTNNMLTRDPAKPTKSFTAKMELVSNMEDFQNNLKNSGYLSDEAMNPFNFHYTSVAKRVASSTDYDLNDKRNVFGVVNESAIGFIETIDENIKDPYENTIAKAGLAFSISPVINKMNSMEIGNLDELVGKLGTGFTTMIDSLTSAAPNDLETAFELTTGINTHKGGGNAKKLTVAHNAAVKLAAGLGKLGYSMSPVKYKLAPSGGGKGRVSVDVVKIEIPKLEIPKIKEIPGASTRTLDLVVKGSSVTKKAFTSGKSRPKSIKGASKIYKKIRR